MKSNMPNTAMIMAAGKGTRMMPLTADRPKPMVEVAGTRLIDHVLNHLRDAGIGKIVVNVHYMADKMEGHLRDCAQDFEVTISDERALLLDTGGGLVQANPLIDESPFFCINADNYWTDGQTNALRQLTAAWDAKRMDVLMLLVPFKHANNTQGQGDFHLDDEGRLSRRKGDAPAPYVWTGIQIISKNLIVDPPELVFSTNIFWDRAIADERCFGAVHDGTWFDVGYPAAIAMTETKLEQLGLWAAHD
jgi:N-acetyl-alpha-D-muramate 1-phosphate uridylyltransferase